MEKTVLIQGETPKRCFPLNLEDPLQRRYEFIREAALSKKPVAEICSNTACRGICTITTAANLTREA